MGALDMQVCVPKDWTDEQVIAFAEKENPCGTKYGWHVRKEGSKLLGACHERVPCEKFENMVHIVLDA